MFYLQKHTQSFCENVWVWRKFYCYNIRETIKKHKENIARIANAVQCNSLLSGHNDYHGWCFQLSEMSPCSQKFTSFIIVKSLNKCKKIIKLVKFKQIKDYHHFCLLDGLHYVTEVRISGMLYSLSVMTDWTNDVLLLDNCKYIHRKSISWEINYNMCFFHQTFLEFYTYHANIYPKLHLIFLSYQLQKAFFNLPI